MSDWGLAKAQAAWVRSRLPGTFLVRDMSWGIMASTVLQVRDGAHDYVVKAGDASNHHIDREIAAHDGWTSALVDSGHAARLIDSLPEERVMLLEYLPGRLVEGSDAEWHPSTYAQAGGLLQRLHSQESCVDEEYEARVNARALVWLEGPHRIEQPIAAEAKHILETDAAPPVDLVPTHGDWQPRNWLVDDGTVRVIDFGRFAFRPAATDLVRLAAQQWQRHPEVESAFFEAYGQDPRDGDRWRMATLREAVGTTCWAFQVGDEEFEAQGHRMLADALHTF